jgi:aldose 1-epimerase
MKKIFSAMMLISAFGLTTGCNNAETESKNGDSTTAKASITQKDWGVWAGKPVKLYTLTNKNGMRVSITNYGGTITEWITPDKNGTQSSIVIGFDSLAGYLRKPPYFGALIGRYGNRIGKGTFKIGNTTYKLATNNAPNHLHGGNIGFDKVVWDATPAADSSAALTLDYVSKDSEEGYPGTLNVTVKYILTDDDELTIDYTATTDKATPVNLTNHAYFNLTGDVNNTILNHRLQIEADSMTPVDATLIPTGEITPVKGTPFDFTTATKIGDRITAVPGPPPGGYDHNWVLNNRNGQMAKVATLTDSVSGRKLEVFTEEPGLQFYAGNFLDGTIINRDGKPIKQRTALCLETQHFPDSPNKPNFPNTILQPGERYHTVTKYKVSVE